jgi:hypothetical protein
MGDVGNFFLGGSKNKSKSEQEATSTSTSTQSSQNTSANGSIAKSKQASNSGGSGYNQAYGAIAQSMSPTLGTTAAGAGMLGALLGVPGYTVNGPPKANYNLYSAPAAVTPPPLASTATDAGSETDMLAALLSALQAPPTAAPGVTPPAATSPSPIPTQPTKPGPIATPYSGGAANPAPWSKEPLLPRNFERRETGGPVEEGTPYIVGEKQPEVFVPKEDGVIVPSTEMYQTMTATGAVPPAAGLHPNAGRVARMSADERRLAKDANEPEDGPWGGLRSRLFAPYLSQLEHFKANPAEALALFQQRFPQYATTERGMNKFNNFFYPQQPTPPATLPEGTDVPVPLEGRAFGGPVNAGTSYMVGENRPEVFLPTRGRMMGNLFGRRRGGVNGTPTRPINRPIRDPRVKDPDDPLAPVTPTVPGVPATPATPAVPGTPVTPAVPGAPAVPGGTSPQQQAMSTWANSAGQKYLMEEGRDVITGSNAGLGFLQSGATGSALEKMRMGLASTYMNQYMDNLLKFSQIGLGGASAMSGAGGVTGNYSQSGGGSTSVNVGGSQGTSTGQSNANSTSSGTSSGSGNSKNGLLPALAAFKPGP